MHKSVSTLLVILCVLFLAVCAQEEKISVSFKDSNKPFAPSLPQVVVISVENINLNSAGGLVFKAQASQQEQTDHPEQTWQPLQWASGPWTTYYLDNNSIGYAYYADPNDAPKNPCRETTTGKVLALISFDAANQFTLRFNNRGQDATNAFEEKYNSVDGFGTWTFECPVIFLQPSKPFNTLNIQATYPRYVDPSTIERTTKDIALTLSQPWFVTPDVEFKSLSVKQSTDNYFSSSPVELTFRTNSTGHFNIRATNGPSLLPYPTDPKAKPNFWCKAGDAKLPIVYTELAFTVWVETPTQEDITCSLYVAEYFRAFTSRPSVATQRAVFIIAHSDVEVKRTAEWQQYPGKYQTVVKKTSSGSDDGYSITVTAYNLLHSTTPLHLNSTVEIKLGSAINVAALVTTDDTYRAFKCSSTSDPSKLDDVQATLEVDIDANSIILSNILDNSSTWAALSCSFTLQGGAAISYDSKRSLAVTVELDGKDLINFQSNTATGDIHITRSDVWKPFGTHETRCRVNTDQTKAELLYSFEFKDQYTSLGYAPIKPTLILYLDNPSGYTFSSEELEGQLTCEATSATRSQFEPIQLQFHPELMSWTYELEQSEDVEAFALQLRCYRTENLLKKFGLFLNDFSSNLVVQYVDLDRSNRYFDGIPTLNFAAPSCKLDEVDPKADNYPKDPEFTFCASATVAVTAYTDAAIKAGRDHFDAAFNAAVKATDATKDVVLSAPTLVASPMPLPGGPEVSWTMAEEIYDMYHTQYGNAVLNSYRISREVGQVFPAWANYEDQSPAFADFFTKGRLAVIQCYTVSKDDSALLDANKLAITKTLWLAESAVPTTQPYAIFESLATINHFAITSKVSGCGLTNGLAFPPTISGSDMTYDWATYSQIYHDGAAPTTLCTLGQTCAINADCASSVAGYDGRSFGTVVCKASTCQIAGKPQSPYILFDAGISNADAEQYPFNPVNSAAHVSVLVATLCVILALFI